MASIPFSELGLNPASTALTSLAFLGTLQVPRHQIQLLDAHNPRTQAGKLHGPPATDPTFRGTPSWNTGGEMKPLRGQGICHRNTQRLKASDSSSRLSSFGPALLRMLVQRGQEATPPTSQPGRQALAPDPQTQAQTACCFFSYGGAEYKTPPSWIHPKTLSASGGPKEHQEGCVQRTSALTCSSVWKKNFCGH